MSVNSWESDGRDGRTKLLFGEVIDGPSLST